MADNLFKYIPSRVFWPMIMGYLALILFFIFMFGHAFGHQFIFNETKQMQDEGRLLEFCIHNTTIKIPELDTFCGLRYGGLNTTYGEQIK